MKATAPEFIPGLSATAAEFVPGVQEGIDMYSFGLTPEAVASPSLNFFAFNDAYLSDDSDDEGSTSTGGSGSSDEGVDSGCEQSDDSPQLSQRAPPGLHGSSSEKWSVLAASEEGGFLAPPPGLFRPPPPVFAPPSPPMGALLAPPCGLPRSPPPTVAPPSPPPGLSMFDFCGP